MKEEWVECRVFLLFEESNFAALWGAQHFLKAALEGAVVGSGRPLLSSQGM